MTTKPDTVEPTRAKERSRVVVVGAGPAGLAVSLLLKRYGVPSVTFEKAGQTAPLLRRGHGRRPCLLEGTLSLRELGLSGDWPAEASALDLADLLDEAVSRHRLDTRLGVEVARITPESTGGWRLETTAGDVVAAPHIVVATGRARVPVRPHLEGLHTFPGFVGHVLDTAAPPIAPETFASQSVLVVGVAEPAAEIAVALWEKGSRVSLAARHPFHVVPRAVAGVPFHTIAHRSSHFHPAAADRLLAPFQALLVGDLRPYDVASPGIGPFEYHARTGRAPVIDCGFAALVRQRGVTIMPGVDHIRGPVVAFSDGRRDRFDAIILATGATPGLESMLAAVPGVLDADGFPRVHQQPRPARPGLWFGGFSDPPAGAVHTLGHEARHIARAIARHRPA